MNNDGLNNNNEIIPEKTVINVEKKKSNIIIIFIIVLLISTFIYFIDDVLAYFNQNFTPVVDTNIKDDSSYNLVDGYFLIGEKNSYKQIKGIKFEYVRKSSSNIIFITYSSNKNYYYSADLKIFIELYSSSKQLLYKEQFKTNESIESGSTRQYKIILDSNIYDNAVYALITNE